MKIKNIKNDQFNCVKFPEEYSWYRFYTISNGDVWLSMRCKVPENFRKEIFDLNGQSISIAVEKYIAPLGQLEDKLKEQGFSAEQLERIFGSIYDVFPDSLVEQDIKVK